MKHNLKILPIYFELQNDGIKNWEIRKNDRNFQVGDILNLNEWDEKKYTGRVLMVEVIHTFKSSLTLKEDYVILSTKILNKQDNNGCRLGADGLENGKDEIIDIEVGDYINGHIVEKIEKEGTKILYLVTYFCGKNNKPQSIKLEYRDIKSVAKKEDFEKITYNV